MIRGCIKLDDRSEFNIQNNNAVEKMKRCFLAERGISSGGTESCAMESLVNGMSAMGIIPEIFIDIGNGKRKINGLQLADLMMVWVNSYMNDNKTSTFMNNADPKTTLSNRYQRTGQVVLKELFNIDTDFYRGYVFNDVVRQVWEGRAVQMQQNIGHFIVYVGYDDATNELIYRDSWKRSARPDGFMVRESKEEFQKLHPQWYDEALIIGV